MSSLKTMTAGDRPVQPVNRNDLNEILQHTAGLWEQLRGERIFLTGGTGFFGCWLLESFLHANRTQRLDARMTVLTRDPIQFRAKAPHLANDAAIELLAGDVRSFLFPAGEFGYTIHAAADTSAQASRQPLELFISILEGTRRVLEFAATHRTRRFLLVSSGAVYGPQPAQQMTHLPETYMGGTDWLKPQAAYAEAKRAAELMSTLSAGQYDFDCRIARCFAFVGPHLPLDTHFAIGNFIRDAMAGRPIRIQGDGTPMRSYLYTSDLAAWLWTMLLRPVEGDRCWNVGSGEAVSIADLAYAVVEALGIELAVEIARPAVAGAPRAQYVPSVEKAEGELGLHVWVGLHEAIRRTAAWHRLRP